MSSGMLLSDGVLVTAAGHPPRLVSEIEPRIVTVRGLRVLLDSDLAVLYGVTTKRLNEQVTRSIRRFPADFMFRLRPEEGANLKSQFATSSDEGANLKSQSAISSTHGGRRRAHPRAFTEQGVAMLSAVLHSPRAVDVNIEIMRAFVRLRRLHGEHADLARRIDELEATYDERFKAVFDAIRGLMTPTASARRPVGFRPRSSRASPTMRRTGTGNRGGRV